MTVTIFDLPQDGLGGLPGGEWRIALDGEGFSTYVGPTLFENGVTATPVDGRALRRICAALKVEGALRGEAGELPAMALGNCSRLLPKDIESVDAELDALSDGKQGQEPEAKQTETPAEPEAPAPAPESSAPPEQSAPEQPPAPPVAIPTTRAELDALSDDELRRLGDQAGLTDRRWGIPKLRENIAAELEIDA